MTSIPEVVLYSNHPEFVVKRILPLVADAQNSVYAKNYRLTTETLGVVFLTSKVTYSNRMA